MRDVAVLAAADANQFNHGLHGSRLRGGTNERIRSNTADHADDTDSITNAEREHDRFMHRPWRNYERRWAVCHEILGNDC
jgi:hypothetical protein